MNTKYVFVKCADSTLVDSAVVVASLANVFAWRGHRVTMLRCESCLNADWGTMNNHHAGECFVTSDGYEASAALGVYEWFTNQRMTRANCLTMGRIYQNVINRERRGEYAGEQVRVVPHVTDEIKHHMQSIASKGNHDFVIVDIGCNDDEREMYPYFDAARQMCEESEGDCVTLEFQEDELRMLASIPTYEVPLVLYELEIDKRLLTMMGIDDTPAPKMSEWEMMVHNIRNADDEVTLANVRHNYDHSLLHRALTGTAAKCGVKLRVVDVSAERVNDGNVEMLLAECDGVIIASDYGVAGVEGKISVAKWCREHDVPTLGIGSGMHCMVIEYARNVVGITEANSTEYDYRTAHNVIDLMAEQKTLAYMGGTMRLGEYHCRLSDDSRAAKAYGINTMAERHRHSAELNTAYRPHLEQAGMRCVGVNPESGLVEVVELPSHKWWMATLFTPEYNSTALHPNLLLVDLLRAIIENKNNK